MMDYSKIYSNKFMIISINLNLKVRVFIMNTD